MPTKTNGGSKKGMSTGAMIGIGAGVLAAAAGAYFFFGPEGKKNRGKLKGWMIKMKGEVIEKMENAKDLTEAAYERIVDAAAKSYEKKGISPETVREFAAMLKRQWKGFSRQSARPPRKSSAKKASAKKAAKKAAKKSA